MAPEMISSRKDTSRAKIATHKGGIAGAGLLHRPMANDDLNSSKEHDENDIIETLYLMAIPGLEEQIVEGMNTPLDECIPSNKIEW